jgi:hypothetical protein
MEAAGDKIRSNSQGWERRAGHRRAAGSIKGQLYLLPEHRPAKFENIDQEPEDFE